MKRLLLVAALAGTTLTGAALAQTAAPAPHAKRGFAAADANGDGALSRAEAIARADAMFARLDKNNDGKLGADERPGRRGGAKADMTREQFREHALRRFDRADTNKDGKVDQAERQAQRGKRMAHHGGRGGGGMHMLMRADANHDGVLTKAEVTTAASAMFDRVDTNRDGKIDQAERTAARDMMKTHHGARTRAATPAS